MKQQFSKLTMLNEKSEKEREREREREGGWVGGRGNEITKDDL